MALSKALAELEAAQIVARQAKEALEEKENAFQRACELHTGIRIGTWVKVPGDFSGFLTFYTVTFEGIVMNLQEQFGSKYVPIEPLPEFELGERVSHEEFESYLGYIDEDWYNEDF